MRTIKRTFANLNKSTLFLGKAGENLVTRLEIDVSKELSEYTNPSFDLILSMPSENEPYPVLATLSGSKLIYNFTENDLSKAGNGQIEALAAGSNGEVLKSTTAKTVIEPSINPNTYPGPIQRFIEQLENNVRVIVMQYNIEVVDALPATARAGKIVYLIGSGFYYYSDGQWTILISGGFSEIIVAKTIADLEDVEDGKIVFVPQTIEESGETFVAGWYRKDEQNFVLVSKLISAEEKTHFNAAYQKSLELSEYGTIEHEDESFSPAFGNSELAMKSYVDSFSGSVSEIERRIDSIAPLDTLIPLALNTTYAALQIRPDWADVPVYVTGESEVVARLSSDDTSESGFAVSEIRLFYLQDFSTGMPCPVLRVSAGGRVYENYSVLFHDREQDRAAGWYEVSDDYNYLGTDAPTLSEMRFDKLVLSSTEIYTDLTSLPDKAKCALDTLSRMVNVSADAMGTLGVIEDGVQRLTPAPQSGKRYAYASARDIAFPLPAIVWSDRPQEFWLDLDCTSTINLTFSETVCYEDGGNVDTTRGKHRLHFYTAANSDKWTVAETESYEEVTEDYLPEYVIPFKYCTADQIRAVLKLGYSDGNGNWCVRRKGGIIQTWFSIGDTHPVTLTDGQEVNMRIIGIEHDDLLNGGKAALTCDFAELVHVTPAAHAAIPSNADYASWTLRSVARDIVSLFPAWLSDLATPARHYCADNIYVIDTTCMFSIYDLGYETASFAAAYPFFTNNVSRIRYYNYSASAYITRTRSAYAASSSPGCHMAVLDNGASSGWFGVSTEISSLAVCFCLNA